ncbi:ATP-binding cassette domain-containing protein [Wenxinia marina]|uniref:ATPase component of ABC transporter with duplicated ATPase domain protein n=1 Tax=Wenxinia marina DSM 24838 TaxID=1123501 RepID=A0A0D0Q8P2_9RHOB|nr:ATP-binding cassette domain-containing protein [Wenxinia marina]KIQ68722.1 ATPase component of ABC transporter with duplicated ATPase domain protein [Wenxinia marina DSM 24838]GGL65690.1 ABC transporter [Wenxinia marina]
MSALILSDLTVRRPDGSPLFAPVTVSLPPGLTGLVGRNGCGKTTLLDAIAGRIPHEGTARAPGALRRLEQAPDPGLRIVDLFGQGRAWDALGRAEAGAFDDADEIDWTLAERIVAALSRMDLAAPPDARVGELSGGEARRAALAAVTFDAPAAILLDEPTNDLDADGQAAVARMLEGFGGVALVASHDRALLERADRIAELSPEGVTLTGGGWSDWIAARAAAAERAEAELDRARDARAAAGAAAEARAQAAAGRGRQGRRLRASGSHGKMLMDMQKQRAENTASGASRLDARAIEAADARLARAEGAIRPAVALRFDAAAAPLPEGRTVLQLSAAEAERGGRRYGPVDLTVTGPERLRIAGPNGAGKSTLLAMISGALPLTRGTCRVTPGRASLDQALAAPDPAVPLVAAYLARHPAATEQGARAALARAGFRGPAGDRAAATLSGGERLRLGLALVLGAPEPPELLILDEPTNHLDLEALELLETGLAGFGGALILVTHDEAFAAALRPTRTLVATPVDDCHVAFTEAG